MSERAKERFVEILYELTLAVGTTLDLDHEVNAFMDWLAQSIRPRFASLFLVDDAHQFLHLVAVHPHMPLQGERLPMGVDPWTWLRKQGIQAEEQDGVQQYAVPISAEGQVLGIVCLVSSASPETIEDERTVVEAGAGYFAPVLRNIWRYRTLEQQVAERTKALAQSEAMFRALVEQAVVGVYLIQDDQFVYVNQAAADIVGRTPEELIHRNPLDFVHPDDRALVAQMLRRRQRGEIDAAHYTFRVLHRDGHAVHVEVYGKGIEYQGKRAILGVLLDISKRVQAEEAYRALVEHSLQGLIIIQDDRIVFANPAFLRATGLTGAEVVDRPLEEVLTIVHPEDRDAVCALSQQVLSGDISPATSTIKFRYRRADGQMRWGRALGGRILYRGKPAVQVALLDITRQEEARQQLERYTRFLELGNTIVHNITHATEIHTLLSTTLELLMEHLEVNMGAVWVLGHPEQPSTVYRVLRGDIAEDDPRVHEIVQQFRHIPNVLDRPMVIADVLDPQQTLPPVLQEGLSALGIRAALAVPLFARAQRVGGLALAVREARAWTREEVILVEEIGTEMGMAVERLRLIADLEEALRAKDEMIQNVSHELRTPLTMILGYTELLQEGILGDLNDDQREALSIVHRNAGRLRFMIDRLLLLQMLDERTLERSWFSPTAWLEEVYKRWLPEYQQHNVNLVLHVHDPLPNIYGDRHLLDEVMDNLLHNAQKFSPQGGTVRVRAWVEKEELYIAVSDEGVGIPPDKLDRIFDRFYQVSQGLSRRFDGMGIGLALCREIVELHGGRIWAESEGEGKGSTFYVALPL